MSMEIESALPVSEECDRHSPLGFRVPGCGNIQKIIEIIQSKYPEHVLCLPSFPISNMRHSQVSDRLLQQVPTSEADRTHGMEIEYLHFCLTELFLIKKGIEDLRSPSNLSIEELTRELKREQIINNNHNILKHGDFYTIYAIDPKTLSETEQAFNSSYDPSSNILSDNDAQIWKTTQPSIKLIAAKDQKLMNATTMGGTQILSDGKIVQGSVMGGQPIPKNSNIIMQSHLTYQINTNAKSFLFEIKDPIILSANIVEKFCRCQKSYEGELMIKCSNDHCQYVWFHPACVGLGNINPKALEDLSFTCEDCKDVEKNAKKQAASAAEKPSRKKVTKN